MKTQKLITIKILTTALFVVTLFISSSCNEKGNSKEKEIETEVKTPNVDIHAAAFMGDVKAIKQYIAAKSDLNVKDQYGSTPLAIATTFGKTEAAKVLIEGGADLNITNGEGSTALHTAAFFCRTEIVEALLAKGADKTLKNNYGSTALESVSGSFTDVKAIYEQIAKQLGPLGLKLDFELIEKTRPVIAEMLR